MGIILGFMTLHEILNTWANDTKAIFINVYLL